MPQRGECDLQALPAGRRPSRHRPCPSPYSEPDQAGHAPPPKLSQPHTAGDHHRSHEGTVPADTPNGWRATDPGISPGKLCGSLGGCLNQAQHARTCRSRHGSQPRGDKPNHQRNKPTGHCQRDQRSDHRIEQQSDRAHNVILHGHQRSGHRPHRSPGEQSRQQTTAKGSQPPLEWMAALFDQPRDRVGHLPFPGHRRGQQDQHGRGEE